MLLQLWIEINTLPVDIPPAVCKGGKREIPLEAPESLTVYGVE